MKKMTTRITIAAISLFILSCNKKKAEDSNVTQDSIKTEEKILHKQRLRHLILMPFRIG
jgi:PBP1b-binding outer membrane lipoprotein LpoB